MAANPKFVYAADRQGRTLILDAARGKLLGTLDTRDFVTPIVSLRTDRIYLGANNGLIVSLHDRDYKKPEMMRKIDEPKPTGKPEKEKDQGDNKDKKETPDK
jgi:hypothetical protein